MSILVKPYEISVWEDKWVPNADDGKGKFIENCIGIIGSDKMDYQGRAIEPTLTRNVNGVKKFSFKMYHKFIDIVTGEKISNPFVDWLINERKAKLKYDGEWYDFIVKNIVENSSNYLYTYQLEDALIQELSKNGFGIALDASLMNNIGTANELATEVLKETDWSISNDSEAFVQTIDETLVYLTLPKDEESEDNFSRLSIKHILDQADTEIGRKSGVGYEDASIFKGGETILAFYSSCVNKPHRFQFIYLGDATIKTDEDRNIKNANCQYYIDFNENPETEYSLYNSEGDNLKLYLPRGFKTTTVNESGSSTGGGVTLSSKFRGKRYGFSQQSKYIPVLNRYVKLYEGPIYTENGKSNNIYYGYEKVKYNSSALTQNVVSNLKFENTSGWIGTHNGASGAQKATVEAVYGRFSSNTFISSIDDLKNGTFNLTDINGKPNYKSYLKVTFPNGNSRLINSGPYDNRTVIGKIDDEEKWAAKISVRDSTGTNVDIVAADTETTDNIQTTKENLNFSIGEYCYDSGSNSYVEASGWKLRFSAEPGGGYNIFSAHWKMDSNNNKIGYSEEDFKKNMQVRICIAPPSNANNIVYYIEDAELFRAIYNGTTLITPNGWAGGLADRVMDKTYYYFKPSALTGITNEEQLVPEISSKSLYYNTYKPFYNEGAQKVRTVTIKESNYFNILQSIAETFEAWLVLKITRNQNTGVILDKEVVFKNYVGGNNYAGFKYGVNLKDIQRTYESKNIVTKLIVKQNSNELAENGFCTIARAGANPTGENCIYDFQYFFNKELLSADDYLNTMYIVDGASGGDISDSNAETNLKGYFPRIKAINQTIQENNELLINTAKDLAQYKAEFEIAKAGWEASNSGIQQVRDDFESLIGVPIDCISLNSITNVVFNNSFYNSEEAAKEAKGYYYSKPSWLSENGLTITYNNKTFNVQGGASSVDNNKDRFIYVQAYPEITTGIKTAIIPQIITCKFTKGSLSGSGEAKLEIADTNRSDVTKLLQEYSAYLINEQNYQAEKTSAEANVNTTQTLYNTLSDTIEQWKGYKKTLNQKFFEQYSTFIQEGTWISEEYVDDEKYYADALSVMYNSCYPQVAYQINTLELSQLPGYEDFTFALGEKTYAEDPDFFGTDKREEVIITELSEVLDNPSKNEIRVQNFKNQFQDLFQKITATVQQTQYRTGSYEKAVALAEASDKRKNAFLTDALSIAGAKLQAAGQQSVIWGDDGITVKSVDSPSDAIRMVGGAILLSKQDENGEQKWVTGVTSDGVSASLITAGILNAGEISIMNYDQPLFRWDSFGISAYDATWFSDNQATVISGMDTKKFVRFDKNGIYGINHAGVDGANWYPNSISDIDSHATFALTWDGLKVTGNNEGVARIGKQEGSILKITNQDGIDTLIADENGNVTIRGDLQIGDGTPVIDAIQVGGRNLLKKSKLWEYHSNDTNQYPISKVILSDGTKEFYRIQRIKTGTNYDEEYKTILSVYNNIILDRDVTEDITNGQITVSLYARGNKERTQRFVCTFFSEKISDDQASIEEEVDGSGQDIKITTNWKQYSLTFQAPQAPNGREWDGIRFGPYHSNTETSEVWDFQLDICQLKIEKGNKATDWSPAPEDMTDMNGNFSWKFSPTEGMFMWKGEQSSITDSNPTGGAVFAIYSDPNETDANKKHKLKMKGIVEAEGGNIAGWNIGTDSLTKGTLGSTSDYPFHMYTYFPDGKTTIADHAADDWRLIIGNNFGVTKEGGIYATKGKIGQMEMRELVNRASAAVGENLLLNSNVEITNNEYEINSYVPVNYLKEGEIYTITVNATPGKGVKYLGVYFSYGSSLVAWLEFTSNTTEEQRPREILSATFTMQYHEGMSPEQSADYAKLRLYRFDSNGIGNNSSTTNFSDTTIHWVKIEKGEVSTPWCLAQQEQQSNSVNGNYSWKFSPTEGIKMWNGAQSGDPVFSVDSSNGLHMTGNGTFTGTIEANGGRIGGLNITGTGFSSTNLSVSPNEIYFTSGALNLDGHVKIFYESASNTAFLISTGEKNFIMKNEGGAGIKFTATSSTTQASVSATLTFGKSGGYLPNHNIYPTYTCSYTLNSPLFSPESFKIYIKAYSDQPNQGAQEVEIQIPSGQSTGTIDLSNYKSLDNTVNVSFTREGTYTSSLEKTFYQASSANNILYSLGHFCPTSRGAASLGITNYEWATVHMQSYSIVTSDKNLKKDIVYELEKYNKVYDDLKPVQFFYKERIEEGYHFGFIAQEIEESMLANHFDPKKFGGIYVGKTDKEVKYSLRYEEFIALNTWQIQKLKPRMASAEEKLIAYEARISALETEIENLKSSQNSDII